jgi:hypothetical protein
LFKSRLLFVDSETLLEAQDLFESSSLWEGYFVFGNLPVNLLYVRPLIGIVLLVVLVLLKWWRATS